MRKIFTILFFALLSIQNINAGTFTSASSGNWNTPATWVVVGDVDGIPDSDDDVTISAAHTVSLTLANNYVRSLVNNGTFNCFSKNLHVYGNFTNNNKVTSIVLFVESNCVYTSTVTTNGITSILVNGILTISANTTLVSPNSLTVFNGKRVNNLGNLTINGNLGLQGSSQFHNRTNSILFISGIVSGTGSLFASETGNTITYKNSSTSTQVKTATYYNLTLTSSTSGSRVATGNITVLNNFILSAVTAGTNNVLNLNNFNLTISGNWFNNANRTITNQGIVTFNGSALQTINRTTGNEVITNMVVASTHTVQLARNLDITSDLAINSGTLDVTASDFTIDIKGNFTNNGAINCRGGLISFTGASPQTISGTEGISFNDLTSSNPAGVSVLNNVAVFYMLRVNSGSFGTAGAGIITIPASGPTTYARIAAVGGSLTGTGWVLESYIDGPAEAGWQWLSSSISGNTLADWDNDPRFYMSGVGGNDGSAGSFRSVRVYNETSGAYTNITSTATPLTPGRGFHIWMSDNMTGLTAPLVYNSTGTPNFGTINFPVTAGGAGSGYNLVGNPYACPIDYSTVVAASGNLYSSFVVLQEDNTYATDPNGGIIAPNQGFMCVAFAGGNITFTEASKSEFQNPNTLRTSSQDNAITLSVYNNVNGIGSRTSINFTENATDNFENGIDLAFLASPMEEADNIYTKSADETPLLRNMLFSDGQDKDVPLTVRSGVYGSHFISAKGLGDLNSYSSVWLEDLTTGKKVDLLKNQEYMFNADEIGKDYDFIVHFSNTKQASSSSDEKGISSTLNENTSVYNTPNDVVVKFDMKESTPVTISVYNLAGQKVIETMNVDVTNDRIALPLQKENGLYLLIIQSQDQKITRKIIY
ncbi:MAG: C-terminal target protein [Bacteroidota bacterium]|jgi:hypothetical protein|nr:C-terminal target protein [Bacteroidota bacterium]